MKRATLYHPSQKLFHVISIHALMKRATRLFSNFPRSSCDFNPRPHEEGDVVLSSLFFSALISIHALMKRATAHYWYIYIVIYNFNPRPHEEGDNCGALQKSAKFDFNPRPHEEGDAILCPFCKILLEISIHALIKRATCGNFVKIRHTNDFNPRPHEEGDLSHPVFIVIICKFQSTPSWRGRHF